MSEDPYTNIILGTDSITAKHFFTHHKNTGLKKFNVHKDIVEKIKDEELNIKEFANIDDIGKSVEIAEENHLPFF